jgi:Flp pilus assembly protein TadG
MTAMKRQTTYQEILNNDRGATAVIVAICMTMLVGFAALAVDVGYLYATRNELQNTADAGALAGAGYLGKKYADLTYSEQQAYTFDKTEIVATVNEVTHKNKAAGVGITINSADVTVGTWVWDPETRTGKLTPTLTGAPDAVRVIARRDGGANGPINTFFARIFGIDTMDVSAEATAALTGPYNVRDLKTPFSLSERNFPDKCTDPLSFSPADSCVGWHNFLDDINAAAMADKLLGFIAGDNTKADNYPDAPTGQEWLDANFDMAQPADPAVTEGSCGEDFVHQGGVIASLFNGAVFLNPEMVTGSPIDGNPNKPAPLQTLIQYFKFRDGDFDDSKWTTTVPVYEEVGETCGNPHGPIKIVGFAEIEVRMPNPPPDKTITATVICEQHIVEGRGGGGLYGLRGSIPNLVE